MLTSWHAPLALCTPATLTFQFLSFTLLPPATGHRLMLFPLVCHSSTPTNELLSSLSSVITSPEKQSPSSMHLPGTMSISPWLPSQCNLHSLMGYLSHVTSLFQGQQCTSVLESRSFVLLASSTGPGTGEAVIKYLFISFTPHFV